MPKRPGVTTMKDVARLAGVSVQTVSCVVNSKPGITQETQERVQDAIQQLAYHPDTVARSLRTRETRTIALVVSDIANPSFATMASAAEDHATRLVTASPSIIPTMIPNARPPISVLQSIAG
jgi:LacI family transcriptional regulator